MNNPGEQRREWTAAAAEHITPARLRELVRGLVDIPSPTGDEAPLAEHITSTMRAVGITAATQPIDDRQANSWGRVAGSGTGPDLMLYAPIDTLTTSDPDQDLPWISPQWRPDMAAESSMHGDLVIGLGASNPKGHAACVIAAAEAFISPDFDEEFLSLIEAGQLARAGAWTTRLLQERAGNGAQEVRTWLIMAAALGHAPGRRLAYEQLPEWLTGMGVAIIDPAKRGTA